MQLPFIGNVTRNKIELPCPEQIVAIQGENPSGYCLVASRIIDSTPKPLFSRTSPFIEEYPEMKKGRLEGHEKGDRKIKDLHFVRIMFFTS